MIEDLEGATAEPRRRPHVAALSTLSAAVSVAILFALLVPVTPDEAPRQTATAAGPSTAPVMTVVSNPFSRLPVDVTLMKPCADGTRLAPPYYVVFDATGTSAIGIDGRTGRSVPVAFVRDSRTSPLFVTCATSEQCSPREIIAR